MHPLSPPKVQRTTDAKSGAESMTGKDATGSLTQLYDYVGALKAQLDALIDAVTARDAPPPPKKRRFHL